MKSFQIFCATVWIGCMTFSHQLFAAIDPTASVVLLRTSCNDGAGGALNNCFMSSDTLLDWIWGTRNPTATTPLLVDIGPGKFDSLNCPPGKGFVTFSGSGRGQTIIGTANGGTFNACKQLVFEHLTISGSFIGVMWVRGGSSSWIDVEMLGGYSAWYDTRDPNTGNPCPGLEGTHKFFACTLKVTTTGSEVAGGNVFVNSCGKNWLWGSEIVLDATTTSSNNSNGFAGITSGGAGNEVHLYGSNLNLFSGNGSALQSITAIEAVNNAEVHVHGTGIDVISTTGKNVIALTAASGGQIHANESAYVLKTSAPGKVTRINNNNGTGQVHAPHLWEHIPEPSTAPNFTSVTGADMTTITASDGHPHLVIYDTSCTSSKWYDTVDKACRP